MAGPVGALVGIIIGNLFDIGLYQHFSKPHWSYHSEQRKAVQRQFFEATFLALGQIAKSDGRVTVNEIQMAKGLMQELRLNSKQKEEAKRLFTMGKQPDFDLEQTLARLKVSCHDNPNLLRLFIDIQYRAAQIDGLSQNKIEALNTIFSSLGFAPLHKQYKFYEDFERQSSTHRQYQQHAYDSYQSKRSGQSALAQAFSILELPETANKQEVKRAYRKLMSQNHPDKLIAQGLPEEMIKVATDKTQAISKAYEQICEVKGW